MSWRVSISCLNLIEGPIGCLVYATIMGILALNLTAMAQARMLLTVRQAPSDPDRVTLGAPPMRHYIGLLKNAGKFSVEVEIMRIPGRSYGIGRFRSCYVERWNSTSGRWIDVPQGVMETGLPMPISTLTVKPGDSVTVCDTTVSNEPAACYRFRVELQLKGIIAPQTLSAAFRTGSLLESGLPPSCRK